MELKGIEPSASRVRFRFKARSFKGLEGQRLDLIENI